jgi:hypothetical protein
MGGVVAVILDTHALVWQLNADTEIGRRVRARLESGHGADAWGDARDG